MVPLEFNKRQKHLLQKAMSKNRSTNIIRFKPRSSGIKLIFVSEYVLSVVVNPHSLVLVFGNKTSQNTLNFKYLCTTNNTSLVPIIQEYLISLTIASCMVLQTFL